MAERVKKKTVFIVDDHPLLRQGLALLVNRESDLTVCGEAEEAQTAMREIATKKPDILIADISLNGPDGLDLLKNLRDRHEGEPLGGFAAALLAEIQAEKSAGRL